MERNIERRTGEAYGLERGAFADRVWEESFIYIKTVVNTVTQPFLLLDKELKVIAANESYYSSFEEDPEAVEHKFLYEIGQGAWDIPELKKILLDIHENDSFMKGFEIKSDFPRVGNKVLVLSARRIYREIENKKIPSDIILLAIEDATELMRVAEIIIRNAHDSKLKIPQRKVDLQKMIDDLEKEMKQSKIGK